MLRSSPAQSLHKILHQHHGDPLSHQQDSKCKPGVSLPIVWVFTAVSHQREEWAGLSDAQKRRDVCHELHSRLNELLKDQEVLSKYVAGCGYDGLLSFHHTSLPAWCQTCRRYQHTRLSSTPTLTPVTQHAAPHTSRSRTVVWTTSRPPLLQSCPSAGTGSGLSL